MPLGNTNLKLLELNQIQATITKYFKDTKNAIKGIKFIVLQIVQIYFCNFYPTFGRERTPLIYSTFCCRISYPVKRSVHIVVLLKVKQQIIFLYINSCHMTPLFLLFTSCGLVLIIFFVLYVRHKELSNCISEKQYNSYYRHSQSKINCSEKN